MAELLPARYRSASVTQLTRERLQLLEAARQRNPLRKRRGGWVLGAGATVVLFVAWARSDQAETQVVAGGGPPAISADLAGLTARPETLLPPGRVPRPAPAAPVAEATPQPEPTPKPWTPRRAARVPAALPRMVDVPFEDAMAEESPRDLMRELDGIASGAAGAGGAQGDAAGKSREHAAEQPTLNVGTRILIALAHPIVTNPNGSPVTARVEADVVVEGRTVVPAGAELVGDAFATHESDRAQIVWSALVFDGKTTPLQAVCLGTDHQLGLPGKVVRKGSKAKRGLGAVLGSFGSALRIVGRGNDLADRAASAASYRVGDSLAGLEREWTVSDKGIRVEAGARALAFLRTDVVIE